MKINLLRWLPLAGFAVLLVFLTVGLGLKPREVPSPLLDRPLPAFTLPTLAAPGQSLSPQDLLGQVWLLNVWASWCVACQQEHPVLVEFAKRETVPLLGLNYKDEREDALRWLGSTATLTALRSQTRTAAWALTSASMACQKPM
jgi:cytochrome c biogenesis protein CcmG/thiol:disulfide interchange protein DsbE